MSSIAILILLNCPLQNFLLKTEPFENETQKRSWKFDYRSPFAPNFILVNQLIKRYELWFFILTGDYPFWLFCPGPFANEGSKIHIFRRTLLVIQDIIWCPNDSFWGKFIMAERLRLRYGLDENHNSPVPNGTLSPHNLPLSPHVLT